MTTEALLVVDVQQGFLAGLVGAEEMISALRQLLDAARGAGALVVHLQDVGDSDSRIPPDSPGRALVLDPREGEVGVEKEADDGFIGTDLERVLREADVTGLVIGGLQSEMCVSATVRGAMARGFTVVLPHDAHATYDIEGVGAEQVRLVAEHALGDQVVLVATSAEVRFDRARR
ncbi:MAG: isochorismatase family protein [Actinomycetota bacterium]|nr:isochorismatase family protein [Actinomycetota bacterium]